MGAQSFITVGRGENAKEAFFDAKAEAAYESGHGGYTGTVAEKTSFKMISVPDEEDPREFATKLVDEDDDRISDKWGPAGCVRIKDGEYLFFGYASS